MEPQKKLFRDHILVSCIFTLVLILIVSFLYTKQYLKRADFFLYNSHFQWRGPVPTSGRISLVLMDQKSADELQREKGSWSRAHMAEALRNLTAAGAEIIGLDMVFFAPGHDQSADAALARAIEECGNLVLAKFIAVEGRGEVVPLAMFQDGMIGDGFINMFPDKDGVLRSIPFLSVKPHEEGVVVTPSFSLEVARAFLDLDFALDFSQENRFLLGAEGTQQLTLPYPDLRIHFFGDDDSFPHLSYVDVVFNRFNSEAVKGKIILIGSSLATDKDYFATPFSGYRDKDPDYQKRFAKNLEGEFAKKNLGLTCHAHAVETILSNKFIEKCPDRFVILFTVITGLLGLLFYSYKPGALWGFVILASCAVVIMGLAHVLFVKNLLWVEIAPALSILSVQYISGAAVQRAYSKKKAQLVSNIFGKYVSKRVVEGILKGEIGVNLQGRSQEITVFFSDLRGFTTLSENLSAQETGHLLNVYFDAMLPIVFEHEGTFDKLMGDAIMAFFGAPNALREHAQKAAETALEMIDRLEALRREKAVRGVEHLRVGIGLNTGPVTVGNLGSQHFMDYTVVGDAVNLGSRLEGLNKNYGTSIIVSESTAAELDGRFILRELDRVRVKGKEGAVTIFELVGYADRIEPERLEILRIFTEGLADYKRREWGRAESAFLLALERRPDDGPARLYLQRVQDLLQNPPPDDWEPITVYTTK